MKEPDRIEDYDEKYEIRKMILRNGSGALCGYITLPEDHEYHGCNYDNIKSKNGEYLEVHGGLTYSNTDKEGNHWIGFDCSHCGDLSPKYNSFDGTYRDIEYVKTQIDKLISQLF